MKSNGSGPGWRARRLDERLPAAGASALSAQLARLLDFMPSELVACSRRQSHHPASPDQAVINETAEHSAARFAAMSDDEMRRVATNVGRDAERWWVAHRAELIATGKQCPHMGCTLRRDTAST